MSGDGAPSPGWQDERLVRACLQGDQQAWSALLAKYQRLIYAIPFRYGAGIADAADIFQTVSAELLAELPKIRKVESLRGWLMTVTARRSLKWKQSVQRRKESSVDEPDAIDLADFAAPDELRDLEQSQVVNEALERLGERCQQLIQRLFYDDPPKAYDELARELGLATGSIGFTRARCLEKLKALLDDGAQ